MRTSEDAAQSGLYASGCCGQELVFCKGDTLWHCPRCHHVCEWQLIEIAIPLHEFERLLAIETEASPLRSDAVTLSRICDG